MAFAQSQELIAARARIGWIWPLFEIFKDKTKEPMRVVNGFLDPILKEAVHKHTTQKLPAGFEDKEAVGEAEAETLLDHLVRLTTGTLLSLHHSLAIFYAKHGLTLNDYSLQTAQSLKTRSSTFSSRVATPPPQRSLSLFTSSLCTLLPSRASVLRFLLLSGPRSSRHTITCGI